MLIVVVSMVFCTTLYWLYKILLSADSGSVNGILYYIVLVVQNTT